MRIALLAPLVTPIREPQLGGSQALVADLARGLSRRGHQVVVFASPGSAIAGVELVEVGADPAALESALYRPGAPAAPPSPALRDAFARAWDRIARERWDVAHNHAFDAPAIALAPSTFPVVHTLHLPPDARIAAALRAAQAEGRPPVAAAVSRSQRRAWSRAVPIDALLSNGVPVDRIPWSQRGGARALYAGRLSPEKGAALAIDIARRAGVGLDLFGDPYDPDYAERIAARADGDAVRLAGAIPREALWREMARARAVLCPIRWEEPFGLVAAEAQAAGAPVVGFARGALPEVIRDGVTGALVPPGDLDAAAAALERAADLSRAACRAHAEKSLSLEQTLDAHEALYAELSRR